MINFTLPANLDALIVTNPYNILYLSGFKGISDTEREAVLIAKSIKGIKSTKSIKGKVKLTLITAKLYQAEANRLKSKHLDVKIASERDQYTQFLVKTLEGCQQIGFEEENLTYAEYQRYAKILKAQSKQRDRNAQKTRSRLVNEQLESYTRRDLVFLASQGKTLSSSSTLIPTKNIVENMRQIKTPEEVRNIEKAQIISQKALDSLLPTIKQGQTELEIAERLESIMRSLGSQDTAFTTIVASGPNSGVPHHVTSDRRLTIHDTLLFDFGAKYQNYCADFSRTVFVGEPSDEQANIYNHVAQAQKSAISKISHGIQTHEPFHAANNRFKNNQLDSYFLHGLGHGIGLEVHELPSLRSLPTTNHELLTNFMVFSVEPGLYFPWGGVRIEDLVVIEKGKPRVLGKMQSGIVVV